MVARWWHDNAGLLKVTRAILVLKVIGCESEDRPEGLGWFVEGGVKLK